MSEVDPTGKLIPKMDSLADEIRTLNRKLDNESSSHLHFKQMLAKELYNNKQLRHENSWLWQERWEWSSRLELVKGNKCQD